MSSPLQSLRLLVADQWQDYALLDSGAGRKLERFGPVTVIRPENQAIWRPRLAASAWDEADAVFEYRGKGENWRTLRLHPDEWTMRYGALTFVARLTPFRHVGVFPEQAPQWDWVDALVRRAGDQPRVLNLFGYTGLASIAAAAAGARVTHLDASKASVEWGRENLAAAQLPADAIRWIVDDALKFVRREVRRGSQYEGIIMDPPAFGRGAQGQVWQFADSMPALLEECRQLLAPTPLFVLITSYDIRGSATLLANALDEIVAPFGGTLEAGEQVLPEQASRRLLATAIFARWSRFGL